MTTRGVLVTLILTATAAFVVGVSVERHETRHEVTETPAQRAAEGNSRTASTTHNRTSENSESGESAETGESGESAQHKESTETTATTITTTEPATETRGNPEASETLLGVNPESTGLLVVAAAVSLLLAAGVRWLGASPLVLGCVALAMAAFGALDIREVVHQADESRTGLVLLAALVAVLHLTAAVLAARAAVAARGAQPPPASAHAS